MIPLRLKILGYDYEVIIEPNRNRDHGIPQSGSCNPYYQKIWIDGDDRPSDGMPSTLLHEILEAINDHLSLKLEHNVIASLESALYQVLKDNKLVFFEGNNER